MKDINTDYDDIIKQKLEEQLGRPAKKNEIVNSDTDANLVTDTLWELILKLDARVKALENK